MVILVRLAAEELLAELLEREPAEAAASPPRASQVHPLPSQPGDDSKADEMYLLGPKVSGCTPVKGWPVLRCQPVSYATDSPLAAMPEKLTLSKL